MIEERILNVLRTVLNDSAVDETCSQQNCEKWDSMNQLNLVVELEIEFGVSIEPEEIARMTDFGEVVRIIKAKL